MDFHRRAGGIRNRTAGSVLDPCGRSLEGRSQQYQSGQRFPKVTDLWDHLDGDSFPILWLLVLRSWAWMGFAGSDLSIRALALLSAFCILAAIWWNSRLSDVRYPAISLLLVACNPVFVRCVGSNRAYGLGIALLLVTYGAIGNLVRGPIKWPRFAGVCLVAILSVQCLYFNTVFLWMMTVSATIVSLCNKDGKRAAAFAGIGLIATATMLPYVVTVRKQHEWGVYIAAPIQFGAIIHGLVNVMDRQGPFSTAFGVCLCILALTLAIRRLVRRGVNQPVTPERDRILFNALCLVLTGIALAVFLWALKYYVRVWYFAGFLRLPAFVSTP